MRLGYWFALIPFIAGSALHAQQIQWAGDWEKALEEAKARNVPIMFTLHKDG